MCRWIYNHIRSGNRRIFPGASGNTSLALAFGGNDGSPTTNTEFWNGSSWTEINNLGTARTNVQGSSQAVSALAFSGLTTTVVANTEEFTADATLSTVTVS